MRVHFPAKPAYSTARISFYHGMAEQGLSHFTTSSHDQLVSKQVTALCTQIVNAQAIQPLACRKADMYVSMYVPTPTRQKGLHP